jgi:hypothetical protein
MACDIWPTVRRMGGVVLALTATSGFIYNATMLNLSFWLAWQSPAFLVLAAASAGIAGVLLLRSADELQIFIACLAKQPLKAKPPPVRGPLSTPFIMDTTSLRCGPWLSGLVVLMHFLYGLIAFSAATCLLIAAVSWIPYVAAPLMFLLIAEIGSTLTMLVALVVVLSGLVICVRTGP